MSETTTVRVNRKHGGKKTSKVWQADHGAPRQTTIEALIDQPEFVTGILAGAFQRFLEAEMDEHIGVGRYERGEQRTTMRNGYKPRTLRMRVGTIDLLVPQARDGSFSTELFARYQRNEKALVAAMMEMYVLGVSTRKVAEITEALCGTRFSSTTVSRLCEGLDREIKQWHSQPLDEAGYPYLFTDATWVYSHDGPRVRRIPILVTWGVRRADGRRQVLDVRSEATESIQTYKDLFASLVRRGLHGVRLVVGDDHEGIVQAAAIYFPGAAFQRCITHYQRNAAGKVPASERGELAGDLKKIWACEGHEQAVDTARSVIDTWLVKRPKVGTWLDESIWQTLNFYAFPASHRIRLRTNNGTERINGEIKRRTRVAQILASAQSALRLAASIVIDISAKWETGHAYLNMDHLNQWEEENTHTNTHTPTNIIHAIQ